MTRLNLYSLITSGSDKNILLSSFFTSQGVDLFSFQHSACGGYLCNSAVISSLNIYGCRTYISYSSNHSPDRFFSNYQYKTLPSLQYHHFNHHWRSKQFFNIFNNIIGTSSSSKVLIVMGEKYPFSPLFQGLYPNTQSSYDYVKSIFNLAISLLESGFDVYVKPYNNLICARHYDLFSHMSDLGAKILKPSKYRRLYLKSF